MGKFRKKPVVIEAIQWTGEGDVEIRDFFGKFDRWDIDGNCLIIQTLEGTHRANPKDWIIRGIKGEFYPCKPDIFEATYDLVKEERIGSVEITRDDGMRRYEVTYIDADGKRADKVYVTFGVLADFIKEDEKEAEDRVTVDTTQAIDSCGG